MIEGVQSIGGKREKNELDKDAKKYSTCAVTTFDILCCDSMNSLNGSTGKL